MTMFLFEAPRCVGDSIWSLLMLFYPLLGAQLLNELSKFGTGGGRIN